MSEYANFLEEESARLRHLRRTDLQALKLRYCQLHQAGYSMTDIWNIHCLRYRDLSYTAVRMWVTEGYEIDPTTVPAAETFPIPTPPLYPSATPPPKAQRIWPKIPEEEREAFYTLARRVSRIRGTTAPDDPRLKAREFYENAVMRYYKRGVRIADIAKAAGVTHRAITLRMERAEKALEQPEQPTELQETSI